MSSSPVRNDRGGLSTPREKWQAILRRLHPEVAALQPADVRWARSVLERIASLQEEMQAIFLQADGAGICGRCEGFCCDRGKNHLTLVNVLAYLLQGQDMPHPDFSLPCPFLGSEGCLIPAGQRPFNCITFLCEQIDDHLSEAERLRFYALEKELRGCYEEFDRRFAGSSLRGIFIRSESLEGKPLLATP